MFFITLILVSVTAFWVGFLFGKGNTPKLKPHKKADTENEEIYKNFLNYDGNVQ